VRQHRAQERSLLLAARSDRPRKQPASVGALAWQRHPRVVGVADGGRRVVGVGVRGRVSSGRAWVRGGIGRCARSQEPQASLSGRTRSHVPRAIPYGLTSPGADAGRGEPSPGADVGRGEPGPGADVAAGEPSPGADVGGVEPSPGADVERCPECPDADVAVGEPGPGSRRGQRVASPRQRLRRDNQVPGSTRRRPMLIIPIRVRINPRSAPSPRTTPAAAAAGRRRKTAPTRPGRGTARPSPGFPRPGPARMPPRSARLLGRRHRRDGKGRRWPTVTASCDSTGRSDATSRGAARGAALAAAVAGRTALRPRVATPFCVPGGTVLEIATLPRTHARTHIHAHAHPGRRRVRAVPFRGKLGFSLGLNSHGVPACGAVLAATVRRRPLPAAHCGLHRPRVRLAHHPQLIRAPLVLCSSAAPGRKVRHRTGQYGTGPAIGRQSDGAELVCGAASAFKGERSPRCRCGTGERSPRFRCGRGERSPGANVGGVSPVPAQMWAG
jgi:hypothetical protein